MIKKYSKLLLLVIALTTIGLTFSNCSGGNEEAKEELNQHLVKIADPPPGADPKVPAEQGGAGFEKIAADLGYVTHEYTPEELKFLGDPKAKKGGMLNSITTRYINTLRTVGQYSNYVENSLIENLCYESLIGLHPVTMEFVPALATHWKISDDKMTFWFRINPDARWSDGMPVVADDVVASFKLRMDETVLEPSNLIVFGKLESPTAESKYIVRVKAKELNWRNFLYFGGMSLLPAHIVKDMSGKEYLDKYQWKMLPGSGPYTILHEDIKKQRHYILTRRKDYWAIDKPENRYIYNFDKIRFVVVKGNDRLRFEKFKKGETDFFIIGKARWWAEETDFDKIKMGWIHKRRIWNADPAGTNGLAFNMRKPPFDDERIRKAFILLINRQKMIKQLFFDQYIHLDSLYAGSVYENPDNPQLRYDPEQAAELLAEAGYDEKNSQGYLFNDKGETLTVELGIQKGSEYVITPYQQELKKAGIELKLKYQDPNSLSKIADERKFQMYWMAYTGLVFPNPETSLHSKLADQKNNNNLAGVKNERIDELCALYDKEFDQKKRVELIREIDKLAMEEYFFVPFWYAPFTRVLYWNKLGHPEYYFSLYGDYRSIFTYWWYDAEKDKKLKAAMGKSSEFVDSQTQFISRLKQNGVPQDVIDKLKSINVEGMTDFEKLLEQSKKLLTEEEFAAYKSRVYNSADKNALIAGETEVTFWREYLKKQKSQQQTNQ